MKFWWFVESHDLCGCRLPAWWAISHVAPYRDGVYVAPVGIHLLVRWGWDLWVGWCGWSLSLPERYTRIQKTALDQKKKGFRSGYDRGLRSADANARGEYARGYQMGFMEGAAANRRLLMDECDKLLGKHKEVADE